MSKTCVLLTNTGTPDAATVPAVRRYLREFLSDPRIVHLPRIIWLPILYGLVLTLRPRKSKALYERIWTAQGAPMRILMQDLVSTLQAQLPDIHIAMAMNYGNPGIKNVLQSLQRKHIEKLIVLPLYPQYSNTTTAATYDQVIKELKTWAALPYLHFIRDYHVQPAYIHALVKSVKNHWQAHGQKHLIISFHGIPKRFVTQGDPYQEQCQATTAALTTALQLTPLQFSLCYQSQFGYDKWLSPSLNATLEALVKKGITEIDVICPGFAIDCLETLEEIKMRSLELFRSLGGKSLNYIPALNARPDHVQLLTNIIKPYL